MVDTTNKKLWLANAQEIGAAIGRSRYEIPVLVRDENFPAFKFYGRWTALEDEVLKWCRAQHVKHRRQLSRQKKG